MQIDIVSNGFDLTAALREFVDRRLTAALDQHSNHVRRVQVRLEDVNGPRGGVDKRCAVIVHLLQRSAARVQTKRADLYDAITDTAHKLREIVGRRIERRQERQRGR